MIKGEMLPKFTVIRRYVDPVKAMVRTLELANAAEADKGRISIGQINRTLLDEGASVEESAGIRRETAVLTTRRRRSGVVVAGAILGPDNMAR